MIRRPLLPLKRSVARFRTSASANHRHSLTALAYKRPVVRSPFYLSNTPTMPSSISHRYFSPDATNDSYHSPDTLMKDTPPLLHFDSPISDSDQMLFGPLDFDETPYMLPSSLTWDTFNDLDSRPANHLSDHLSNFSAPSSDGSTQFDFNISDKAATDSLSFHDFSETQSHDFNDHGLIFSKWSVPAIPATQTSPLPIPARSTSMSPSSFFPYANHLYFPPTGSFSPGEFAAHHPLPRSVSPLEESKPIEGHLLSVSPGEISLHPPPAWTSGFWDTPHPIHASTSPRSLVRPSPLSDKPQRQRPHARRDAIPLGQIAQSSSAPSAIQTAPTLARSYSRRAESASVGDDRDATVRRKKRVPAPEDPQPMERSNDNRKWLWRSESIN
jgi:hypothetical protein